METIYNIPQLIELIERKNLNSKQICRVLSEGFKIYADEDQDVETLIQRLKDYDFKYKNNIEKPLFLDAEIDIDGFLKEHEVETKLWTEYKTTKAAIIASLHKNKGSIVGSNENNTYYLMGEPCLQFTIPHHKTNE